MKLKNDLRVLFDGVFMFCIATILQGAVLYTLFFGNKSILLLFAQIGIVLISLYGAGSICTSWCRITIQQEGILVNKPFHHSSFSWAEIKEIGFVDIDWRKPKVQYVYFSRHRLTSKHREMLGANLFSFLASGLFISIAPEHLPIELQNFEPYRNVYKQCFLDGTDIQFYQDNFFLKAQSSALFSNTCMEFMIGILTFLTAYVILGLNGFVPVNLVLASIFYLLVLWYVICFYKKYQH